MQTIEALHSNHKQLSSEILFLKKEIDFLLKILRNCYSSSVHSEKIKLMDSYWKNFEKNTEKLDVLLNGVRLEEKNISTCYQNNPQDLLFQARNENEFSNRIKIIETEIKAVKDEFYEFMQGCKARALKTS